MPAMFVKSENETDPIRTFSGVRWFPAKKSWVNQDLFIRWIQFEFPFVVRDSILLVFDSARAHISKKVKAFLHSKGILFAVIPGGLTGLLQPCDVVWFKPLKDSISREIDIWKASSDHELTRNGNPRPPTCYDMSRWLSSGWDAIESGTIINSFNSCFWATLCVCI